MILGQLRIGESPTDSAALASSEAMQMLAAHWRFKMTPPDDQPQKPFQGTNLPMLFKE